MSLEITASPQQANRTTPKYRTRIQLVSEVILETLAVGTMIEMLRGISKPFITHRLFWILKRVVQEVEQ